MAGQTTLLVPDVWDLADAFPAVHDELLQLEVAAVP